MNKIIDTWKLGKDKSVSIPEAIQDQVYDNTSYDDETYCYNQITTLGRIVEFLLNKVDLTVEDLNEIVGQERYMKEDKTTDDSMNEYVKHCLEEIFAVQKEIIEYPALYTNLGVIAEIVYRIENRFGVKSESSD